MKKIFLSFVFLLLTITAKADIINISLEECEGAALKNSPAVKAVEYQVQAAKESLKSQNKFLYPSLTLDASGGYVSVLPFLSVMGRNITFGDYWSYSAGPMLAYSLFDGGERDRNYKALQNICDAKERTLDWEKKSVITSVRIKYFQIQALLEKIYILYERLNLARSQYNDISINYQAGAKSELDLLMSQKQVLNAQNQIENVRSALGESLKELFAVTVDDFGINSSEPAEYRTARYVKNPSCELKTDGVDYTLTVFSLYENFVFDDKNPYLMSLDEAIKYYENVSLKYKSQKMPSLKARAGAYLQYPNGPVKEDILQGTASLTFSLPLFEGGSANALSKANEFESKAEQEQKEQILTTLKRDFYGAKDRVRAINVRQNISEEIVKTSRKAADLTYVSYQMGRVTFLEVQTANYELSQSKMDLIDLKIEKLANLTTLAALGKKEAL